MAIGASSEAIISKKRQDVKFRPHQVAQWDNAFQQLLIFRAKHNHCLVPYEYDENPSLSQWVKRQRSQYNLFLQGKHSNMTRERAKLLEDNGFVWDAQEAAWQERLRELLTFKKKFGHCAVPVNYSDNPKLGTWVKRQRWLYKLSQQGKPASITVDRIITLESHGFMWNCQLNARKGLVAIDNTIGSYPFEKQKNIDLWMDILSDLSDDD